MPFFKPQRDGVFRGGRPQMAAVAHPAGGFKYIAWEMSVLVCCADKQIEKLHAIFGSFAAILLGGAGYNEACC